MAILIDPPAWPAHGTLFSHLVSDGGTAELHVFARRLGIPRRAFDLDHYDVAASHYDRAIALGAEAVSGKAIVHALRDSGLRVRQADRSALAPIRRREYLFEEWDRLGALVGAADAAPDGSVWSALGAELIERWNEPHRRYHDERHLEDVLLALDHLELRGERVAPATLAAAWFHDAVYTGREDDEGASAELAMRSLSSLGVDAHIADRVGDLIAATRPGASRHGTEDAPHLFDADLAIFASSEHRYAEYSAAVRLEYLHVPDESFARGRVQILRGYLEQPSIYRTSTARSLWEDRARANVAREIDALGGAPNELNIRRGSLEH